MATRYSRPSKYLQYTYMPGFSKAWSRRDQVRRFVTSPIGSLPCRYEGRIATYTNYRVGSKASEVYLPTIDSSMPWQIVSQNASFYDMNQANAMAQNKCYDRFLSKASDFAQLGATLGERKQAVDMIATRAAHLRFAYRDLRRGDLFAFLSRLGIYQSPETKRRLKRLRDQKRLRSGRWTAPKEASALWLEFHFGWSPLLGDIRTACSLLEAPFRYGYPIQGTGTGRWSTEHGHGYNVFQNSTEGVISWKQGATMFVENPNLHRATTLGLTNPVSIAWELVPFSFVVDWFLPVGNFLNSWTDLLGLRFENAYNTRYLRVNGVRRYNGSGYPPGHPRYNPANDADCWITGRRLTRELGVIRPVVFPKQFKGFSVIRGATAISLLLQVFKHEL